MSRLTKLFRRPRAFFRDGIDNFMVRNRRIGKLSYLLGESRDDAQSGSIADNLVLALVGTANMRRALSDDGDVLLGCRSEDVPWVIGHALRLARKRGLSVPLEDLRRARKSTEFTLRFRRGDSVRELVSVQVSDEPPAESEFVELGRLYARPADDEHQFDVDIVYTWVNHDDEWWRSAISAYKPDHEIEWDRFINSDELRYSMRSVAAFAPWVRNIYIVTNCSPPAWLAEHPKVRVIPHTDIFPPSASLPTFNSHAIEACLMNIDGLAECFVYFNDDMFLGRATSKATFFTRDGASVSFLEPDGAVFGDNAEHRPDYMNAAINGRELLEAKFGVQATRLHQHTPYALKRSVLDDMVATFPDEFERVRSSRFRSRTDISSVSFLYHHYAYATREAIRRDEPAVLIHTAHTERAFDRLLNRQRKLFFCINDGARSASNESFQLAKGRILTHCFPQPAPWER